MSLIGVSNAGTCTGPFADARYVVRFTSVVNSGRVIQMRFIKEGMASCD